MAEIKDMLSDAERAKLEETAVEAEVLTDSSKSTELALADPFQDWAERKIELARERALLVMEAWDAKAMELVKAKDAAYLTDHVVELEINEPYIVAALPWRQVGFEITMGHTLRPHIEEVLQVAMFQAEEQRQTAVRSRQEIYYAGLPT